MPNIPSVDLNNFLSDDKLLRNNFVKKLGKAYNEIGFVALKGHFLNEQVSLDACISVNLQSLFR